jgi:hypothetical protein
VLKACPGRNSVLRLGDNLKALSSRDVMSVTDSGKVNVGN